MTSPTDYAAKARELAGGHKEECRPGETGHCICKVSARAAAIEAWGIKLVEDARKAEEPIGLCDHGFLKCFYCWRDAGFPGATER